MGTALPPEMGAPLQNDRRRTVRYPFVATVEITDEKETTRSSSQMTDLSLHGCYVETQNPFPQGTSVLVEIYTDSEFLETQATVAYRDPHTGMGLQFGEMQPYFAGVLTRWLAKASDGNRGRSKGLSASKQGD